MKKALVIIKVFGNYSFGDIYRIDSASKIDSLSGNNYRKMARVDVPAGLENEDIDSLKAVLSMGAYSIKLKKELDYPTARRVQKEKEKLSKGIRGTLKDSFGIESSGSASAWALTAQRMSDDPSYYSSRGLVVVIPSSSFSTGDLLDTNQKCTDYSGELLIAQDEYLINRMLKYKRYLEIKDTIEA